MTTLQASMPMALVPTSQEALFLKASRLVNAALQLYAASTPVLRQPELRERCRAVVAVTTVSPVATVQLSMLQVCCLCVV